MRLLLLLTSAAVASGCRPPTAGAERGPEVQFRPDPAIEGELPSWILERVPGATWDRGLSAAVESLLGAAGDPGSRLTPTASADALGLAGYPGNALFARSLNGGALPEGLADEMSAAALTRAQPVDVAVGRRVYDDGTTLWVGAMAHRPAFLDPLPRDLALDDAVAVRVELAPGEAPGDLVLFLAPPFGQVERHRLTDKLALWIDRFHVPGAYRLEVVHSLDEAAQVAMLWTLYVDADPPEMPGLPRASGVAPDPDASALNLYRAINDLRLDAGLRAVEPFPRFEPLAQDHARHMSDSGVIDHVIPGVTPGVRAVAHSDFFPRAIHRQDVAVAADWREALDLIRLSPGHLQNLLCASCTHAAVGAATEDAPPGWTPRLFVAVEMLEFPEGPPLPLEQWDR